MMWVCLVKHNTGNVTHCCVVTVKPGLLGIPKRVSGEALVSYVICVSGEYKPPSDALARPLKDYTGLGETSV